MIHVQLVREFKWSDVILVIVDRNGIGVLVSALRRASQEPSGEEVRIEHDGQYHIIAISDGPIRVEPDDACTIWCLSPDKVEEIIDKLLSLDRALAPCHHYVDIDAPAPTLFISIGEYSVQNGQIIHP